MRRVAVIGAGLAGLVVARALRDQAEVTVFEKSRGVGGRMATRYAGDFEFDHGTQFFTARSATFRRFLEPLVKDGVIEPWRATFAEIDRSEVVSTHPWSDDPVHYVGAPRMNEVGKYLAEGLRIQRGETITALAKEDNHWRLQSSTGRNPDRFDWVILTAPASQTAALAEAAPTLRALCAAREMKSCVALMLGFDKAPCLPWQAALVRNADISWISVNSSKPGRAKSCALVVHSTNAWADAHLDDDRDAILSKMLSEASRVTSQDLAVARHAEIHRWRFANIDKQSGPNFFLDADMGLAACGDWFIRGRIEASFRSAHTVAKEIESGL